MSDKWFWCIGGGSLQIPVVNTAKEMGYRVIVTDKNSNCDCRSLADIFVQVDIFDIDGHINVAKAIQADGKEIAGVIAAGIDANVTHSYLDSYLGHFRTASSEAAMICHNKHRFRDFMRYRGYKTPSYAVVENRKDIVRFMRDTGLDRCLIKATSNSAGRGMSVVHLTDSPATIEAILEKAQIASNYNAVLAESMFQGSEHTVETLIYNHTFYPCFITDRMFAKMSTASDAPQIETWLRNPTTLPHWKQKMMYDLALKISNDLSITNGAVKLDVMSTPDGPVILEATTRLSGGFDCQYLVPAATGKNIIKAAIIIATTEKPNLLDPTFVNCLTSTKRKVALSVSMWPKVGSKIVRIDDTEAKKIQGVELIYWRYKEGDVVEDYVDSAKRVCFIIVSADTEEEAVKLAFKAQDNIILEVKNG